MSKDWKIFPGECPACGDEIEAFTDQPEGWIADGDTVRCVAQCGATGTAIVFDVDDVELDWKDEGGCTAYREA